MANQVCTITLAASGQGSAASKAMLENADATRLPEPTAAARRGLDMQQPPVKL